MFSIMSGMNLFFCARSFSKASMSSGGYSDVVIIVYNTLAKNTNAPIANATLTDIGTTPEGAELLTPSCETIQGRLLAIHVPIPIISV